MTDKIRGLFTRSFTTKIESNRESQNQKTERSLSPSSPTNKYQPKSVSLHTADEHETNPISNFPRSESIQFDPQVVINRSYFQKDELKSSIVVTEDKETERRVRFMTQDNWHNDDKCYVCTKEFNKIQGSFRHHCRICAKSVCGECSSKRIADQRACDLCYMITVDLEGKKRRENFMQQVEEYIKAKQLEVEQLENLIQEQDNDCTKLQNETNKVLDMLTKEVISHESEYRESCERYETGIEKNQYLKKEIDRNEKLALECNNEIKERKARIKQEKKEKAEITNIYLSKVEEFNRRNYVKTKLEDLIKQRPNGETIRAADSIISVSSSECQDSFINALNETSNCESARERSSTGVTYDLRLPTLLDSGQRETKSPKGAGGVFCGAKLFQCYN